MIAKKKLTDDEFQDILRKLQEKYRVSDMDVDIVYLKYGKRLERLELMRVVWPEYHKSTVTTNTLINTYKQHMAKDNVKMYIQDVIQTVKDELKSRNTILSIGERMEFLSKVISGEVKEPSKSPYGGVYQKEADIKTKIQAVNILNDYDLKSKEMQTGSEIIIEIVGEPIDMNAHKKALNSSYGGKYQSDSKVSSTPLDECFKDVVEDAV